MPDPLTNSHLAELLMREAESATAHRRQALTEAAHAALMWPEEASAVVAAGRPLQSLPGIGPSLARRLQSWLETPPALGTIPETRREFLTLAEARRHLRRKPAWAKNLRGDLQMHTTWSDGGGSIVEMAVATIDRHYEYIAITDHTQGLKIANGLDASRLAQQGREIDALNLELRKRDLPLTVLRSAEVNLSPTGEADLPTAVLARLDLVLGCFHSALRRDDDQTERYLSALRNPAIHILGHPQTRMYHRRPGLLADWPRVFAEAARLDKAVEIDAYADRQDLRLSLLKIAKKEGCRVSLGTDAHHPEQLAFIELGLAAALQAGIPAERILPFQPLAQLRHWVATHRAHRPSRKPKG